MGKTHNIKFVDYWPDMEQYLIGLNLPNVIKLEQVGKLLEQSGKFPFKAQIMRRHPLVKQFVATLQTSDTVYVEDAADSLIEESGIIQDVKQDTATIEGKRVKSLDDLIAACDIDLEVWEVERYVSNKWEVGAKDKNLEIQVTPLYQIKAWLRRKKVVASEVAIKGLIEEFKSYVQPVPRFTYQKQEQCAAIINLYDAHIDKVCLVAETGYGSTIEDNIQEFETLFDELLSDCASKSPELLIIPIGHDFFNTNGPSNATKRGTPQATSVNSHDSFKVGVKLLRRCIDKAAQVARVKVLVIKANHSEDKDFYLGQVLDAVYENNPNVELDTTRKQRKYVQYGENLFGFAHGDKEKGKTAQLPLRMAEEEKHKWADTTFRTFLLGDIHHKEEYQFIRNKDFPGVEVKFLRSIGTTDEWHYDNGYIGVPRTGEAEIHRKSGGIKHRFFAHAQYRNQLAS
ncbi:hypothetical protein [Pontibacter sp. BT731]|uniref:hypothetical protein n=1 Tax=Pontibacter coccineus TaxID=3063328 RepID=UPI0026E19872|nr:hypothetical protein [Pontibacter sp. BT731]